jgi:alkanesulfonate monooxygenase SsuD/methylene tetrahydromethanopterin reductase-like flavin-dependent oxidoreductase (luciferase family)
VHGADRALEGLRGGESNPNGSSFESIAWACGLLAATRRLQVFCTVHVPLHHPLVAAKQMATGDHIGRGRLGVNIVCGWNEDEFTMFGVTKKEHDARYDQGEEWWTIVKRIWAGETRFDYEGTYYRLHAVEGAPRPFGDGDPLMMNAGSSETGRRFAIRHSDMHFDAVETPEASTPRVAETKRQAREHGRDIQVWTPVGIICRPTQKDADDYLQYVVDRADWGAIGPSGRHARRKGARGLILSTWCTAGTIRSRAGPSRAGPTVSSVIPTRSRASSRGSRRRVSTAWRSTSWTISRSCRTSRRKCCRGSRSSA